MKKTNQLLSLRRVGLIEGMSFMLLLGVAMPLKYIYDMPLAVSIVGAAHGFLFIWYCIVLLFAKLEQGWTLSKTLLLFVASVLPLGPFVAEIWLKEEYKSLVDAQRHQQEISA
jgi:integral membrane protein